jgi:predicted ATPase
LPIRDCTVIAVEGTHASGKTTLVHALVSHYRERGVHVTSVDESARTSPFIEEIVVHGRGNFDLVAELDVFGSQLSSQVRAARHHSALVTDKSPINVVAYARLLLPRHDDPVVDAMLQLCVATASFYDAVLYTSDTFDPRQPSDKFRSRVGDRQADVDEALRDTARAAGLKLIDIPRGLTTAERVRWASAHLATIGLLMG